MPMQLTIRMRLFLAMILLCLVVLSLNAAVTRWRFERGFLDYVAANETEALAATASALATVYEREGGFERFAGDPRRWHGFVHEVTDSRSPDRPARAPRSGEPERGGRRGKGPPPPPGADPLGIGRRMALRDAAGNVIVAAPGASASDRAMEITVAGVVVGSVTLAPRRELTDNRDREFAAEQQRSIYIVAFAALAVAALVSVLLARQFTQPVRALAQAARAVSGGDYDTHITLARDDELGELATEFNALTRALAQHRDARRRWVADIAHELRTPLAILRGELDAIDDGVRTFDAGTKRSLRAEVNRLSTLVAALHELSIYDEGGVDSPTSHFDVVAFLSAALDNAEARFNEASIRVSRRLPAQETLVRGHADQIDRVFTNLIENTLRYTDRPGELRVDATVDAKHVVITFADSAPSVPKQALTRLFDRLFRTDESRNRATGGSGLGLAICKAIVETHGGEIDAAPSVLGGVAIRVRLPLSTPEDQPA